METKKKLRVSKHLKISNERLIEGIIYYQTIMGYDNREMAKILTEDLRFFEIWKQGGCKLQEKCKHKAYEIIVRLANRGLFDLSEGVTLEGKSHLD